MKSGTRRMAAVAVLAITALVAAACGGSSGGGSASSASSLTIGWSSPPDTLNPTTSGARSVAPIDSNIFDRLVWLTPDLKVTPHLATAWSISPDGKEYTLTLRQGVKFHDGTPFNADAVVANFNYITDKTTQSTITLSQLGPCTKATATAAYTVVISCTRPYAPLLTGLGGWHLGMQSPAAISKYGKDLGNHPVGTGPFEFVSYTPNQNVVLKRNPDYQWAPPAIGQNGPAKLSKITFNFITNSQSLVGSLQSGQSQLIQGPPGLFFKSLKSSYQETMVGVSGMGIFAPINASSWPTSDLAVRQAILYSIDRTALIQLAAAGVFTPLETPLSKDILGYDPSLVGMYPHDPAKAAQVLTAGGWTKVGGTWTKGGRKLSLTITALSTAPEYPLLAQALQGQLHDVGMEVSVQQLATPAWLDASVKGNMSLTPSTYSAVDPDGLHTWFLPGQYYNWSHYSSPELTRLIEQGQATTDTAARVSIYQQIQKFIMQQALLMPIHENQDLLMYSKKLTGIAYFGGGVEYFYGASLSG